MILFYYISRPYKRSRLCYSVAPSVIVSLWRLCIVAKRCVLEQKLLLTAYRKSYEKSIGTKTNDLDLCLDVVSRSCQPLRYIRRWISRKRYMLGSKGPPIGNGLREIKWSRDRWRHVTSKGQTRDLNTLRAQYILENSWRCMLFCNNR